MYDVLYTIPIPTCEGLYQEYMPGLIPDPITILDDHQHDLMQAIEVMTKYYHTKADYVYMGNPEEVWEHPVITKYNRELETDYEKDMMWMFCTLYKHEYGWVLTLGRMGNTKDIVITKRG